MTVAKTKSFNRDEPAGAKPAGFQVKDGDRMIVY
jgi:hypothetical protein